MPWLSFTLTSLLGFPGSARVPACLWTLAAILKETLKDALEPAAGTGGAAALPTHGCRQEEQLTRNSSGIVRLRDTAPLPYRGGGEVLLKCLNVFIVVTTRICFLFADLAVLLCRSVMCLLLP